MKTLFLGLFLGAIAFLQPDTSRPKAETAPPKVIARFDKISNGFIINNDILRKDFAEGGKIQDFNIQKTEDGFFLIRRGIDAKKQYRTEAFRLQPLEKNGLHLILDFKVKWYTVCSHGSCWCHKIGNSCECAEGGDCLFGRVPVDDDIEIIVIA